MATVRDIAKRAGVSISTVSRVLNHYHGVNEETRQQVQAVIEELNYHISDSYIKESKKIVGIIMPIETGTDMITHPTILDILSSMSRRLSELGILYSILMINHASDPDYLNVLGQHMDAYVLLGTDQISEDELVPLLLRTQKPIIAVNRWMPKSLVSYVNIDDVKASFLATEHLIKLGHKKVAIVNGNPSFRNSQMRFEGYAKALTRYDIPLNESYVFYGSYSEEYGRKAAQAIHQMEDRPTALFSTSDVMALGMQKYFQKQGYQLPGDMSIVGFGDVEFSSYIRPKLTTVKIPTAEMGIQTANVLDSMLRSKLIRYMKVALDAALVIRESTTKFI